MPFNFIRRRAAPPRTLPVEACILCADGTVKTLTVHIPQSTPLDKTLDATAIALFAQYAETGPRYRIHTISQRINQTPTTQAPLSVNAEGPMVISG